MKTDFIRLAILGVTALILTVTGVTAFADTSGQPPQPPTGGAAPVSIGTQLAQYVTSGVLTQAEVDAIAAYMAEQDAARKTEMDAMKTLTEAQRQAQMTGEKKAPATIRQQLLDADLISEAQAAAIDWTAVERPARGGQDGKTAPGGDGTATGQAAPGTGTQAVSTGITVKINGTAVQSAVAPHADKNGRTLIELRSVAEALGAEIGWDAATQTVTLTSDTQTVTIKINQSAYKVNGQQKTMDTAAVIENGRTMVPVRVIAEALGATVSYDAATKTVSITQ